MVKKIIPLCLIMCISALSASDVKTTEESMKNKNILISGAGIAGLTLAHYLKQYGFNPTIIEKHPELRAEGYKIDIRGVAVDVVKRMNLHADIYNARTDIKESLFVNDSGKIITEAHPDLCGVRSEGDLEIVRGTLCEILYNQLDGVECIFDDSITKITQDSDSVEVEFKNGKPRTFDLVIGADGLHSKVRQLTWGNESQFLKELGLYISFYSIPNFLNLERVEIEYHSPKKFVIAYCPRDGMAKAGFAFSGNPGNLNLRNKKDQQKFLLESFKDAGWEVPNLLKHMEEAPDFYFDNIAQVHMENWAKNRVTLAGDSVYAVSPIAGQGASVALVGAYVLAGELAKAHGDYEIAFSNYQAQFHSFAEENQALAKTSASIMEGKYSSWIASKVMWFTHRLGQVLPASLIHLGKKWGLRQTTKAANALTLEEYA